VNKLVIATRASPLALVQAEWVARRLREEHPGLQVEFRHYRTTGDRRQEAEVKPEGETKGIFTKEIEEGLLKGEADLAVHSCKDLAVEMPEGLVLAAVPPREAVGDVWVGKKGMRERRGAPGSMVLTSSPRRARQWMEKHPRTRVEPVRGNVGTRLQKMAARTEVTGCLLAQAGLNRLNLDLGEWEVRGLPWMVPAPGQGALALQTRAGHPAGDWVRSLNDEGSWLAVEAERHFVKILGAGCSVPLGMHAIVEDGQIQMEAVYYRDGDEKGRRGLWAGRVEHRLRLAEELAREVG
jgi:hydroxymethylbilane synthase